ncbi:thioester reductase [Streptomyces rubellomurinus subsp. indigoferus]|nr:thioester reductase [Streptomyces rubellomurinus subsp. indigoferus]
MTTIWDVVRRQAERDPAAVAVQRGDELTSYRELTGLAVELSDAIATRTGPGALLALDAVDGFAGAVAFLAAARAGCAVLPLNQESPAAHRAAVLRDARPALTVRHLDGHGFTLAAPEPDPGTPPRSVDGVAYVMYTSGSTGTPKGVAVSHTALLDRLAGLAQLPGLAAGESVVSMTALSFDISLAEILLPLTVGARLLVAPPMARVDPEAFIAFLAGHRPDVVQATPSFWRLALAGGWPGSPASRLWSGGEALSPALAADLLPAGRELWNLYGPTEATIWATAALVKDPEAVSLGDPLPGTSLLLAAEDGPDGEPGAELREPGQEGEVLLLGAGLADGYLDRDDLTRRAFQWRDTTAGEQRAYRTGDRARYRADGSLEYLGRTDGQVKLRGHRIELGEIEAALERHPAVSQAAVVLRDGGLPSVHVAAFLVTTAEVDGRELRRWLRDQLPPSHHPRSMTVRDSLPRTVAGKVDRVRLATE